MGHQIIIFIQYLNNLIREKIYSHLEPMARFPSNLTESKFVDSGTEL